MAQLKNFLSTRWGIIGVGAFIGVLAPLLQKLGNPGNMGICVACFERDISGALGLHRAGVVQYMRPEIIGFVLGSLIAAYIFISLSFGVGPLQMPKGVLWRPISLERYYVIAPPEYTGVTDEELLLEGPYLRFKPFKLRETIIDKAMKRRGLQLPAFMELDAYDSIIKMVNHNLGVGIVPEPYIDSRILYEFRCHPFCTPQLTRESGLMVRYDNGNMHLATLLWETLQMLYNKKKSEFGTHR